MEDYKSKLKNFDTKETLKKRWADLTVIPLFFLALFLRLIPLEEMDYLQALDSYLIFRMSQTIAYTGSVPILDFSRYFPFATPDHVEHQGAVFIPAIMYWMGPFLFYENYLEYAQAYPAFIGAISVVVMYFLTKEIFDKITGLTSAFFLATISGVMHRSSAGFFQKDPLGMMLMLFSLLFFVKAWKKENWLYGILSGVALGLFSTTWGGSSINWLLFASFAGAILFLNVNTKSLIAAYTPTIIIGVIVAATINPQRFWFDDYEFLGNLALLFVLWARYLVEEFRLIEENKLDYFVPSLYSIGFIGVLLSPLYSQFIANQVSSLLGALVRETGTIGTTVAENTPMNIQELSTELGSVSAMEISPILGMLANIFGTWPLAFIGVSIVGTWLIIMLNDKYGLLKGELTSYKAIQIFTGVFITWIIVFSALFQSPITAVLPSILLVIGVGIFYYLFGEINENIKVEQNWLYLLPLIWVLASIMAATQQSRVVFPASYPVAMIAGVTFAFGIQKIPALDFSEIEDYLNPKLAKGITIGILAGIIVAVNISAGLASVATIGESPNEMWFDSLESAQEETEPGSVLMSWWDYGYWFITIGERPNIADGGNLHYFTDQGGSRMPYHLANYFIEDDPGNSTEILEKHSVDYIVLDQTMIGKYSAVSQIGLDDNVDYQSMTQTYTRGGFQDSLTEGPHGFSLETYDQFGQLRVYTPLNIDIEGEQITNVEIDGQPTIETQRGRGTINCVLTDEGVQTIEEDEEGETPQDVPDAEPAQDELCIAEDPFYSLERGAATNSQISLVLVPKSIAEHNINRLYLMDGYGIDYVESFEPGSNDFVKMWEVDHDEIEG